MKTIITIFLFTAFVFIGVTKKVNAMTFGIEYANPEWTSFVDFPKCAKRFANIDVHAMKIHDILWRDIEPNPPVNGVHSYHWDGLDNLIRIFQSEGFTDIEVLLQSTSSWGMRSPLPKEKKLMKRNPRKKLKPSLPPHKKHKQDYYDYIYNVVERYDGDGVKDMPGLRYPVSHWEIETAAQGSFSWLGTVKEYIQMLQVAYSAAKSANPNATIILSGIELGDLPSPTVDIKKRIEQIKVSGFLSGIKRAMTKKIWTKWSDFNIDMLEAKEFFDVVEFHALEDYLAMYTTVNWIKKLMTRYGYNKPIQAGDASAVPTFDMGPVASHPHPFAPLNIKQIIKILANRDHPRHNEIYSWFRAEQSRLVVKKSLAGLELGLEKINFGIFTDSPTAWSDKMKKNAHKNTLHYNWALGGFMDKDYVPHPAYYTYKLTVEKLKNARFVKRHSLGSGVYSFELSSRNTPLFVIWSEKNVRERVSVGSSFNKVKITHIVTKFNEQTPYSEIVEVNNGNVTLDLTEDPLFLEPF
ncbi:hypothetical protein SCALIN_C11_0030 [Candidatus Scalindua japonica]|uniref:Beta-galactosidase n=1 Tax=Candidatus Scalindua japonica TaxID=1284222 RepID=A0A286TWZ9_9BACT|nr:hypothetical protein [Candidatus Scalindua japonica]GAX60419.1 hypothetical protein SCALIN_C11_0030 [Candidatus Scalindua japonica]